MWHFSLLQYGLWTSVLVYYFERERDKTSNSSAYIGKIENKQSKYSGECGVLMVS